MDEVGIGTGARARGKKYATDFKLFVRNDADNLDKYDVRRRVIVGSVIVIIQYKDRIWFKQS